MKAGYKSKTYRVSAAVLLVVISLAIPSFAQSGGVFQITDSVIASGADSSAGGIFEVDSTVAQPVLGGETGWGTFSITSGFWNYNSLAPTAAQVSVSGRVVTPTGAGLVNAALYLQTRDGQILVTRSGSFGYYMFEGIEAGQTVFVSVESKRYTYAPRTIILADEITNLDFTPEN